MTFVGHVPFSTVSPHTLCVGSLGGSSSTTPLNENELLYRISLGYRVSIRRVVGTSDIRFYDLHVSSLHDGLATLNVSRVIPVSI